MKVSKICFDFCAVRIAKRLCCFLFAILVLEIASPLLAAVAENFSAEYSESGYRTLSHEMVSLFLSDESLDEERERWESFSQLTELPVFSLPALPELPATRGGVPPHRAPGAPLFILLSAFRI